MVEPGGLAAIFLLRGSLEVSASSKVMDVSPEVSVVFEPRSLRVAGTEDLAWVCP